MTRYTSYIEYDTRKRQHVLSRKRTGLGRLLAALALSSALLTALTPAEMTGQRSIEARIDSVRAFFRSGAVGTDVYAAMELIGDTASRARGTAMYHGLLNDATSDIIARFRLTVVFLFERERLPDSTSRLFGEVWRTRPLLPPESEHERIAGLTALLLAAEALGTGQEWHNGRTTGENRSEARESLLRWISETTEQGQQEFDSPTYGPLFITSMLLIHKFARDRDLARKTEAAAVWLLADQLHEFFGGQFGGAHAREDMNSAMQPMYSDMSSLCWLWFGEGAQTYAREQYLASRFDFRPHPVIVELALGKLEPFVAIEVKRSADRIRGDTAKTRDAVKYTYFDPLYVIGHVGGGLLQPREQHTWDATWWSDSGHTTLFTMHPYSEGTPLTEFFPHDAEQAYRTMAKLDPFYGTTTKTVGGSPFEHIFQHRNTVIALYDIPDIRRYPFMVGFIPMQTVSFDVDSVRTGWITINAGDVYVAYFPLRPGQLLRENRGRRLFSPFGKNGAVVQIASAREVGGYAEFRKRILRGVPDTSDFFRSGRVRYTTIFNTRLDARIGSGLRVNNKPVKRASELLFDSPWITSRRGSGLMTIKTPRGNMEIDMRNSRIQTR